MTKGRMDKRTMNRNGLTRLRFYDVNSERLKTIESALAKSRAEGETEHDTVALEYICQHYLASG